MKIQKFLSRKELWWPKTSMYVTDEEGHKKANWIELYFDLVFVITLARLSHVIEELFHHDIQLLDLSIAIIFIASICVFWRSVTIYCDYYEIDTIKHRVFLFMLMIPIAVIGGIAMKVLDNPSTFAYGLIVTRLALYILWSEVKCSSGYEKESIRLSKISYIITVVCAIIALIVQARLVVVVLFTFCLLLEVLMPLLSLKDQDRYFAISKSHYPERYGLFVMLIFGENIVYTFSKVGSDATSYLGGIIAFLIISSYWWIYYDQFNYLSFKSNLKSLFVWDVMHLPLVIALFLVKHPLVEMILNLENRTLSFEVALVFIVSNSIFLLSVIVASFSSDLDQHEDGYTLNSKVIKIYMVSKILAAIFIGLIICLPMMNLYKIVGILIILMLIALQGNYYWVINRSQDK